MLELMDRMMALLGANMGLAFLGALFWGVASVALSPCHLSSIPLVMAFVAQGSRGTQKRAILLSSVFTLGILVSMAALGVLTTLLGRMLGDVGTWTNWLGAGIFALAGLLLLDVISLPQLSIDQNRFQGGGVKAALVLGFLFGTVLGPCAFGFMMPVLGMAISRAGSDPIFSGGLILSYSVGHGLVIILAGSASVWTVRLVSSRRFSPWLYRTRRAFGVLMLAIAIWFVLKR